MNNSPLTLVTQGAYLSSTELTVHHSPSGSTRGLHDRKIHALG
jgi:hypothetical protein